MIYPIITKVPMSCYRVQLYDLVYDVFTPDVNDVSSIVNITDQNGDVVPFDEWERIGQILIDFTH